MTKKFKFFSLLLILPIFTLVIGGCGKSVSQVVGEKAAEKIIENQTGGKAKVDINNGNVKVETKDGNIETGSNVKLPADFPSDIYVIDGNLVAAISDQSNKGFTISIETTKSPEEASSLYQEKLKAAGWKITGTMNFGGSSSVLAEKDNRTVSVVISKSGDKTTVVVGVAVK